MQSEENDLMQKTKGMKELLDIDSVDDCREDQLETQQKDPFNKIFEESENEGGNNETFGSFFGEVPDFEDTCDFSEFRLGSFRLAGEDNLPSFHVTQQYLHQNEGEFSPTILSDQMNDEKFGGSNDGKRLSNGIVDSAHSIVKKSHTIGSEDCGKDMKNSTIWEMDEALHEEQDLISLGHDKESSVQNDDNDVGILESELPHNNEPVNQPTNFASTPSLSFEISSPRKVQQLNSANNGLESNPAVEIGDEDEQDIALRDAFSKTSLFPADLEQRQTSYPSTHKELSPEWNPNFSPSKCLTPTSDMTDEDAPIDLDTMEKWDRLLPLQLYEKTPTRKASSTKDSGPVDVDTLKRWKPTKDIIWKKKDLQSAGSEITVDDMFIKARKKLPSPLLPKRECENLKGDDEKVFQISSLNTTLDKVQGTRTDHNTYPLFEPIQNAKDYEGLDYEQANIETNGGTLENDALSLVSQGKLTLGMLAKISALVDFEDESIKCGSSHEQSDYDDFEDEEDEELDGIEPKTCTSISFDPSDHDIKLITEVGRCAQVSTRDNNSLDVSPFKIDISDIQNSSQSQEELNGQYNVKSQEESPFQSNISAIHQNQSHHCLELKNSHVIVAPRSLEESFDRKKQVGQVNYDKDNSNCISLHETETKNEVTVRSAKAFWQEKQSKFVKRKHFLDGKEKRVTVEWGIGKTERNGTFIRDLKETRDPSIPTVAIVSQDSISECFGDDFSSLCPSHQTPLTADLLAKNSSLIRSSTSSPTSFFRRTHPTSNLSKSPTAPKSKKRHDDCQGSSKGSDLFESKALHTDRKLNDSSQASKKDSVAGPKGKFRSTTDRGRNLDDCSPSKHYKELLEKNKNLSFKMEVTDNQLSDGRMSPTGTRDSNLGPTSRKTFRPRKWVSGLEVAEKKETKNEESDFIHNTKATSHDRIQPNVMHSETIRKRSKSPLLEWREKLKQRQLQHSEEKLITATDLMTNNPHRHKPENSPKIASTTKASIQGINPLTEIHVQETYVRRGNTNSTKSNFEDKSFKTESFASIGAKSEKLKRRLLHNLPKSKSFGNEQNDIPIDDDAMSGTSSAIADRIATFETRMRAAAKAKTSLSRVSKTSMNTCTQPTSIGLTARSDVGGLW